MDMYGQRSPSTPQKLLIVASGLALLVASHRILFAGGLQGIRAFGANPADVRNEILFDFNLVTFARLLATLFVFLRRRIPWEEAVSIPAAFAVYFVGFALVARSASAPVGVLEAVGVALFIGGSFVNTFAEYQRHRWKSRAENRGRVYTSGLFGVSMHVNYFGDLLWVTGYACVTHNSGAFVVPMLLFTFFYFINIPKLDAHLQQRYGAAFSAYARRTKKLVPFVL